MKIEEVLHTPRQPTWCVSLKPVSASIKINQKVELFTTRKQDRVVNYHQRLSQKIFKGAF